MNKKFLFMSMLASLFITACSQDDLSLNNGEGENGEATTSYLAVNLMSSDAGSRAATGYEDGSDIENDVTKVRFYFFNAAGGAANVKLLNGSYVNYYDWEPKKATPPAQGNDTNNGDDIESKLTATIVINTSTGDKVPQSMAAVLNPTGLDNASKSLSQLQGIVNDYADAALTTKGNFVMYNSVYKDKGDEVYATPIEASHLCTSESDAITNPVTIYVERSVAKVRVTLDASVGFDANGRLKLKSIDKDKNETDIVIDGQQVYLMIGGWGLTAETSQGRLVKKINPAWPEWAWGTTPTYRSFWAINAMSATNTYTDNYNNVTTPFTGTNNFLYTNENAQLTDIDSTAGNAKERTKVVLKGLLCKEDGTPLTLVRHLGTYFVDEDSENEADNLKKLKESILNQLSANGFHYYYLNTPDNSRSQITVDDLKIVIADQDDKENSKNNCYVYAQLTDAAKAKTWYNSTEQSAAALENGAAEINSKLKDKTGTEDDAHYIIDRPLVWKKGMTYYYYAIKHTSTQDGVVRNHIYDTHVTKIAGLGTPVYDPTQVIYPEKPDPNNHFIAAEINILSWRIVKNEYSLEW